MTQADLEVLSGFADVWERVSGQRLGEAVCDAVTWEDVLEGLYGHWQGCKSLACRAAGAHARRLHCLAKEAERLFNMAQTEYFLETGDIAHMRDTENFASYTPYNLRKACKNAAKLAQRLQKAEQEGKLPVEDAGETVKHHEIALKQLLSECLK